MAWSGSFWIEYEELTRDLSHLGGSPGNKDF